MQALTPAHVPAGLGALQAQGLQESDQSFCCFFLGFPTFFPRSDIFHFIFLRSDINFFPFFENQKSIFFHDVLTSDFTFHLSGVIFPFF